MAIKDFLIVPAITAALGGAGWWVNDTAEEAAGAAVEAVLVQRIEPKLDQMLAQQIEMREDIAHNKGLLEK